MAMYTPWLIQRCKLRTTEKGDVCGIDTLLSYDYMGSAEFEFGALQAALRELVSVSDKLVVRLAMKKEGRELWVVAAEDAAEEACGACKTAAGKGYRTQDPTGLNAYIEGQDEARWQSDIAAWWDLEHAWMAFREKKVAELAVFAVKQVRARWVAEGKLKEDAGK